MLRTLEVWMIGDAGGLLLVDSESGRVGVFKEASGRAMRQVLLLRVAVSIRYALFAA